MSVQRRKANHSLPRLVGKTMSQHSGKRVLKVHAQRCDTVGDRGGGVIPLSERMSA
jgi:hypothetical protein